MFLTKSQIDRKLTPAHAEAGGVMESRKEPPVSEDKPRDLEHVEDCQDPDLQKGKWKKLVRELINAQPPVPHVTVVPDPGRCRYRARQRRYRQAVGRHLRDALRRLREALSEEPAQVPALLSRPGAAPPAGGNLVRRPGNEDRGNSRGSGAVEGIGNRPAIPRIWSA